MHGDCLSDWNSTLKNNFHAEKAVSTITLDELGPIILQQDGRLGRLSNWHDMTEPEQAATLRFVAKRIAKRRQTLLKAQAGDASEPSR